MAGKSNQYAKLVVGYELGKRTTPTPPDSHFIRLYTAMPNQSGTGGTQVASANGYAPKEIVNNTTNWVYDTDDNITNGLDIVFDPASGGDWGIIVGFGLWTGATTGSPRYLNLLETPIEILDGQEFKFFAGDLVFDEQ